MVDDQYARLFGLLGELREEIERVEEGSVDEKLSVALGRLSAELTVTGNRVAQLRPELVGQITLPDTQLGPPTMGDHEDEARRMTAYGGSF